MKQIIRLSLLCAAFAGFSAVFAGNGKFGNTYEYSNKKERTKETQINITLNNTSGALVERRTYEYAINNIVIPDSVINISAPPHRCYRIINEYRFTSNSPIKLDDGKKPKCTNKNMHRYNTRLKVLDRRDPNYNVRPQYDEPSKRCISKECSYLSGDNCSSLVRSLMYNCDPFYYKEYLTSCGQVERGIYHNNDSIFYSVGDGEKVIIKVKLPDGSIRECHFPD